MSSDIYLIPENNQLVETKQKAYQSEVLLQSLLVAGEQVDSAVPRSWLLVSEDETITNTDESGRFWALDHLFLDQNGIPTLVKVQRGNDTPIRREIVSQMLDYSTNAVNYWSVEKIRAQFEVKPNAQQLLVEFLGEEDVNADQFWQQVKTNLLAVNIRLVFVAAQIPAELKRIVEFLNQQMKPAQFFAIEINQYVGQPLWVI